MDDANANEDPIRRFERLCASDDAYFEAFLANPLEQLRKAGIAVTPEREVVLRSLVQTTRGRRQSCQKFAKQLKIEVG